MAASVDPESKKSYKFDYQQNYTEGNSDDGEDDVLKGPVVSVGDHCKKKDETGIHAHQRYDTQAIDAKINKNSLSPALEESKITHALDSRFQKPPSVYASIDKMGTKLQKLQHPSKKTTSTVRSEKESHWTVKSNNYAYIRQGYTNSKSIEVLEQNMCMDNQQQQQSKEQALEHQLTSSKSTSGIIVKEDSNKKQEGEGEEFVSGSNGNNISNSVGKAIVLKKGGGCSGPSTEQSDFIRHKLEIAERSDRLKRMHQLRRETETTTRGHQPRSSPVSNIAEDYIGCSSNNSIGEPNILKKNGKDSGRSTEQSDFIRHKLEIAERSNRLKRIHQLGREIETSTLSIIPEDSIYNGVTCNGNEETREIHQGINRNSEASTSVAADNQDGDIESSLCISLPGAFAISGGNTENPSPAWDSSYQIQVQNDESANDNLPPRENGRIVQNNSGSSLQLIEATVVDELTIPQALEVVSDASIKRKKVCLFCMLVIFLSFAIVTVIGVLYSKGNDSSDRGDDFCQNATDGDLLVQCRCFNEIINPTVVTSEMKYRFENLTIILGLDLTSNVSDVYNCNPSNLAAWWLSDPSTEDSKWMDFTIDGDVSRETLELLREKYALVTIFLSLNGYFWLENDGWLTNSSLCTWNGVECSGRGGNVIGMKLGTNNLSGTLPNELTLLSDIKDINLASNHVYGNLKSNMLTRLHHLRRLNLAYNQFTGHIPDPVDIKKLLELLMVDTLDNKLIQFFSEYMPHAIEDHNLANLSFDDVLRYWEQMIRNETLAANFPFELVINAVDHELYSIDFSNNLFTGNIPHGYTLLNRLRILKVQNNRFNGHVFRDFRSDFFVELADLDISGNHLKGQIPSTVGCLPEMKSLCLNSNSMTGMIPSEIGLLGGLVKFDAGENAFTGTIPSELGLATRLEFLNFAGTALTGSVPIELCEELVLLEYALVDCPWLDNCSCCCCKPTLSDNSDKLSCSFR